MPLTNSSGAMVFNLNLYQKQGALNSENLDDSGHSGGSRQNVSHETFSDAIRKAGFEIEHDPIPDGKIHRFGRKKACWYSLHQEGDFQAGVFGDWRTDEKIKWCNKGGSGSGESGESDSSLNYKRDRLINKIMREHEEYRAHREKLAIKKANDIFKAAQAVADGGNPYLERKKIKPVGEIKAYGKTLILPCYNSDANVVGLQFINPDGSKRFLSGQRNDGVFSVIQGRRDVYAIAEGYATAASIYEATGWSVIIAFNSGNLTRVAKIFKRKSPIICGDNDSHLESVPPYKNIGIIKAREAAAIAGSTIAIPNECKDWNDFFCEKGAAALRAEIYRKVGYSDSGAGSDSTIASDINGNIKRYKLNISSWGVSTFSGEPPERKWLVDSTIPMNAVTLISAAGDAGKGLLLLDLALKVSRNCGDGSKNESILLPPESFGHPIIGRGKAVVIMAEDDKDEVHRRLFNLGMRGDEDLLAIPLPNACGPMPLVVKSTSGSELTAEFFQLVEQIKALNPKPVLLIIDPLSSFIHTDINADPAAASFVTGTFAQLATDIGCSVILSHHLAKTKTKISTPEEARNLIRGSTALENGCRCAIVFWQESEQRARKICADMGYEYQRNRVFNGAVVKSNGPADRDIKIFVRNEIGLLVSAGARIKKKMKAMESDLSKLLLDVIAWAADIGHPFTMTAGTGVYNNKERLPKKLRDLSKYDIDRLLDELLVMEKIGKHRLKEAVGKAQWLDVPGGKFSKGEGELAAGLAPNYGEDY